MENEISDVCETEVIHAISGVLELDCLRNSVHLGSRRFTDFLGGVLQKLIALSESSVLF